MGHDSLMWAGPDDLLNQSRGSIQMNLEVNVAKHSSTQQNLPMPQPTYPLDLGLKHAGGTLASTQYGTFSSKWSKDFGSPPFGPAPLTQQARRKNLESQPFSTKTLKTPN